MQSPSVRKRLAEALAETLHENTKVALAMGDLESRRVPPPSPSPSGVFFPFPPVAAGAGVGVSLESAISQRRSVRAYGREEMPLSRLARFLCLGASARMLSENSSDEAHGFVSRWLQVYAFFWGVEGLKEGTYFHDRARHGLIQLGGGPSRQEVADSLFQKEFSTGTGILLLVGDISAAVAAYGCRGYRYLLMQAGVVGETLYLLGGALGIGVSANGGLRETLVQRYCGLDGVRRDLLWSVAFGPPAHESLAPGQAESRPEPQ